MSVRWAFAGRKERCRLMMMDAIWMGSRDWVSSGTAGRVLGARPPGLASGAVVPQMCKLQASFGLSDPLTPFF